MRKYDHLFFDLDDTIWDFKTNSRIAMEAMLTQKNILKDLKSFESFFSFYEGVNSELWSKYHQKEITKEKLIYERFSKSMEAFGINGYTPEELNHAYLEYMGIQTRLFPETLETLKKLQIKGYKMHIITNGFKEVQAKKITNCNLNNFFDKIFISEEIKSAKPHREIFEYALKSTNSKKKKSIMIGDSWETDILGARNYGIDQIMILKQGEKVIPEAHELSLRVEKNFTFIEIGKSKTYFIDQISYLLSIL